MKVDKVKPAQEPPEYRVDDSAAAWVRFREVAQRALTTPKDGAELSADTNAATDSAKPQNHKHHQQA